MCIPLHCSDLKISAIVVKCFLQIFETFAKLIYENLKNHKNREKLRKLAKFAEILILERCKGMHIL